MHIDDFDRGRRSGEADAKKLRKERPWRKDAEPVGKLPSNPNYPTRPFNYDEWMASSKKMEGITLGDETADMPGWYIVTPDGRIGAGPFASRREASSKTSYYSWFNNQCDIAFGIDDDGTFVDAESGNVMEDSNEIPEVGDTIRTKKMQMEGKVEKLGTNRAGYDEVLFRIEDGRLMKTPLSNVIVIQKLADEDNDIFEERVDELSTELLAKYKAAAGADARAADAKGDVGKGDKRFSGIVKATKKQFNNDAKKGEVKEGSMGGINRVPELGLSHEDVLGEVVEKWLAEKDKLTPQISYDPDNPPQYPVAKPHIPPTQAPSIDPFKGDPAKQAKAPKNAKQGSPDVTFSELVRDTVATHGVKWAFDYYVKKHGLPPRQFRIFAGI